MCGIAGILERDERVDLGRLHRMSALLRHRGPDDEGLALIDPTGPWTLTLAGPDTPATVLASPHRYAPGRWAAARGAPAPPASPTDAHFRVGLLNRRLAILDLSAAGHGPMSDAEGRCWITYNGEIYNYVELRRELESLGRRFESGTDTEVALAAYQQWGPACLSRFNGMFAFALWDGRREELFCARDRFGVKPLYYQWDGRRFAFASEPKALVLTQDRPVAADPLAVRDLLALDWVDHESRTFFADLVQLPAAHYVLVGKHGFERRRWWDLDPARRMTGTAAEWTEEYRRLFTDAVTVRLRSDVEVGSCLSGGIDSSAVVTTAAPLLPHPLHAFTCAYDEGPAYDERRFVRAVCQQSGAISHVVVPDGSDFWETFDRLTVAQDEPTAGSGLYSQWKVMELAHDAGLKVLLDGQGGDETLAGYFRYLPIRLRDLLSELEIGAFLRQFGAVADRVGLATALGHTFGPWLPRAVVEGLRRRFGQGKDRVLSPALRRLDDHATVASPPREFPTALSRQLAFDTLQRLLPSLLRYEDRNSMAFSIETRLPFLDYRLVEFVFALPDDQKLDGGTTKAMLRRALGDRIPRPVLERRDKMGFETPTDLWLRRRFAAEARRRLLDASPFHEWVDPAVLRVELEEFLAGRRAIGLQVWRWLSLESWARRFVAVDPRVSRRDAGLGAWRRVEAAAPLRSSRAPAAAPVPVAAAT